MNSYIFLSTRPATALLLCLCGLVALYRNHLHPHVDVQHAVAAAAQSAQSIVQQTQLSRPNGIRQVFYTLDAANVLESPGTRAQRPGLRVAIVNDVPFHLEVVAGLMHVLQNVTDDVTVYLTPQTLANDDAGFLRLVSGLKGQLRRTDSAVAPAQAVIFVSPEYNTSYAEWFIKRTNPQTVFAYVHNANSWFVPRINSLPGTVHLLGLAPHVAAFITARTGKYAHWLLPVFEWQARFPCMTEQEMSDSCQAGFSVQGNLESFRRNYTSLWNGLGSQPRPGKDASGQVTVKLLGRGDVGKLKMPRAAAAAVTVLQALPYGDYYETIHHSTALVPLLGSPAYLSTKFSSTMLTSLITCTPIVADPTLLKAYRFFANDTVLRQNRGEAEIAAMRRALRMSWKDMARVRAALCQLRHDLNVRNVQLLTELLRDTTT